MLDKCLNLYSIQNENRPQLHIATELFELPSPSGRFINKTVMIVYDHARLPIPLP